MIVKYIKVPEDLLTAMAQIISTNPSPVVPVGQILEVLTRLQQCDQCCEEEDKDTEE